MACDNNMCDTPPDPAQCHECHACHAKQRRMSPSAVLATQSAPAPGRPRGPQACHQTQPISATPAAQNASGCRQVPACHAKCAWRSGRLTGPKTQPSATKCLAQDEGGRHQVPHLPHKVKVDVAKCQACHAKCTQRQARHQTQPSAISATPATQKLR